jgi:hypothetical protein
VSSVADAQRGDGDGHLMVVPVVRGVHQHRFIRNQLRQLAERVLRAHDGAHLDPVSEQHDRDEGRELPPEVHAREAEQHRGAVAEGHHDRERDEGHHAGLLRAQLLDAAADEDEPAVEEDRDREDGGDELAARETRAVEPEDVLQAVREDEGRDGEHEAQPELAAELRRVVVRVVAVARVMVVVIGR